MKKLKIFLALVFILTVSIFLLQPSKFYISDYYYLVSRSSDYGQDAHLFCKLGCDYDISVDRIKKIYWTKSTILLQRGNGNEYYIILARSKELMCCNRDSIIGPLSKQEYENNLHKLRVDLEKFEYKEFD